MNSNISKVKTNECFGCSSCAQICPKGSIKLLPDEHGFLRPIINNDLCCNCGLCLSSCPAINRWNKDEIVLNNDYFAARFQTPQRKESSSGGVFPALSSEIIMKGGVVCGCVIDDSCKVKHVLSDDPKVIKNMSDSKYVQSDMEDCYSEVYTALKAGRFVLFSGTSCQVHGLKLYLKTKKQDTAKLLSIDLICHGVPSPLIFQEYIKFYELETNTKVQKIKFRSKKYGWGDKAGICNYIQSIITNHGIDDKSLTARLWHNVFFSDLATRESCFNCPYTTINKPADITIGDFWGIGNVIKEMDDHMGTSLVIARNDMALKSLKIKELETKIVNDEDKIKNSQSKLKAPCTKPDQYNEFWEQYMEKGFGSCAHTYFLYNRTNRIKYRIKMKCYDAGLIRIGNRIFNEILL